MRPPLHVSRHRPLFAIIVPLALTLMGLCSAPATPNPDTTAGGQGFLPGSPLVGPLIAHHQEPRVGVRKEFGSSRLKLDIGSTLDIWEFRLAEETRLRVGVEFFTYALTTSAEGLRLQVDAVDGFFGGHFTLRSGSNERHWAARLRILHLSSHFLDGHYDVNNNVWKDNRPPLPFTKDFGELIGVYTTDYRSALVTLYSGFAYATLIRPAEIKRFSTVHGIQMHSANILGPAFGRPANMYVAYHLSLTGIPAYAGSNNVECGVKFGSMNSTGVKLYFSYCSGPELFSQYYNVRREYWGVGFAFDSW